VETHTYQHVLGELRASFGLPALDGHTFDELRLQSSDAAKG